MRIAEGLEMLELRWGQMVIHPTIAYDRDGWTLIDTGMPGFEKAIREAAKAAGLGDLPLRGVILTHQDADHIGSLRAFAEAAPEGEGGKPTVYAHEEDRGAIDGDKPMIKLTPERKAQMLGQLPEELRQSFAEAFDRPNGPLVNETIADGDVLPIAGGLTVIHTPGHTPGHVSLYHESSKTLIAGDAMVATEGVLQGPNPNATPNMEEAIRSLGKFKAFDIRTVVCYHGGLASGDVNARIAELAGGA